MHKIFVYGTLKRSDVDTHELSGYIMYNLGRFPGIRPSKNGIVSGQIIEVDDDELHSLDLYEGAIGSKPLYVRENVLVQNKESNEDEEAWTYVFAGAVNWAPVITSWPPG